MCTFANHSKGFPVIQPKSKPAPKQPTLDFSDDEKVLKPKAKPAPKKATKKVESDFDES